MTRPVAWVLGWAFEHPARASAGLVAALIASVALIVWAARQDTGGPE